MPSLKTHECSLNKTNYTNSTNKLNARWIYSKEKGTFFENRIRKASFLDHKLKCNVGEFLVLPLPSADRFLSVSLMLFCVHLFEWIDKHQNIPGGGKFIFHCPPARLPLFCTHYQTLSAVKPTKKRARTLKRWLISPRVRGIAIKALSNRVEARKLCLTLDKNPLKYEYLPKQKKNAFRRQLNSLPQKNAFH